MTDLYQSPVPPLDDVNGVLNYGADAQARVAEFSEITLENLNETDLENVSEKLTDLIVKLQDVGQKETTGIMGLFQKKKTAENLKLRFRKACGAVDKIALSLRQHRDGLMKDIERLELLYSMNREQYERLSFYLDQGREALEKFQKEKLIPLRETSERSDEPTEIQALRDATEQYHRFEKKLHDLELTRSVSLQMAPQIRILQNNNTLLAEKIQSSIVNAIPLWKSQMMLTLGMERSRSAIELQDKVSHITDTLLKQNAHTLKETTLAVTRQAEESGISFETLRETNQILIETLDEMVKLREEGRKARQCAEEELQRLHRDVQLRLMGEKNPTEP